MSTTATRTTSKKGRFYSGGLIPPGEKYTSVTTILQAIGKPALVAWSANVEREMVIDAAAKVYETHKESLTVPGFVLLLKGLLGTEKAHAKELAKAGEIGSKIHELVEWSLRVELLEKVGPSPILGDEAQWAYGEFQKWRQGVNLKPIHVEATVFCNCHKIAGTMDLLAEIEGVTTVCDWKSGRRVYGESFLQNAAYRHCVEQMGIAKPEKGIILRLPKIIGDIGFEAVNVPGTQEENFETFLHVKALWDWQQQEELRYLQEKPGPVGISQEQGTL